jgi:hypothetical protein
VFAFLRISPVGNASDRASLSTIMVRSVGLSEPLELSGFSVDRSGFVDRRVESVARLDNFELA